MEENMINVGYWILEKHSNFFEGNARAKIRFMAWLAWSALIFSIQWVFMYYFC
jgi:hypothetical protein